MEKNIRAIVSLVLIGAYLFLAKDASEKSRAAREEKTQVLIAMKEKVSGPEPNLLPCLVPEAIQEELRKLTVEHHPAFHWENDATRRIRDLVDDSQGRCGYSLAELGITPEFWKAIH